MRRFLLFSLLSVPASAMSVGAVAISVVQSVRDWILSSDYIETSVSGVFNDTLGNSYIYSGPSTFLQYMYDNGSSSGSSRRFSVLILISVFPV